MEIKVDIPDKIYNEIDEMCKFNSITLEDYVVECVMDNFYTLKYGDLNVKLGLVTEEKKVEKKEEVVVEPVVKKRPGRPRKKVEEPKVEEVVEKKTEPIAEEKPINAVGSIQEIINEPIKEANKIKRTRTLKVK